MYWYTNKSTEHINIQKLNSLYYLKEYGFSVKSLKIELKKSGVELLIAQGIHNKTLCVDEAYYAEGSFNWLSASRDNKYARHEVSLGYKGEKVAKFIADTRRELEDLVKRKI